MLKGFRFRLAPTIEQAEMFDWWAGACRSVWNTGLEQRLAYRQRGGWINYAQQCRELATAKKEFPWLAKPSSDALQQTLMDLDRACRKHGTFKIRWRSRSRWRPSLRFPQRNGYLVVQRLSRKTGQIWVPKLGWVRLRWSRPVTGVIRSMTIRFEAGHWWVSVLAEDGKATPEQHRLPDTVLGVDRGVKVAAADSAGGLHDRDFVTTGEQRRIVALQRRMSRQDRKRRAARAQTSNRAKHTRAKLCKVWAEAPVDPGYFKGEAGDPNYSKVPPGYKVPGAPNQGVPHDMSNMVRSPARVARPAPTKD